MDINTENALVDISNIAAGMVNGAQGFDPIEQFRRIRRIAEQALEEDRRQYRAMLDAVRNGGSAE